VAAAHFSQGITVTVVAFRTRAIATADFFASEYLPAWQNRSPSISKTHIPQPRGSRPWLKTYWLVLIVTMIHPFRSLST